VAGILGTFNMPIQVVQKTRGGLDYIGAVLRHKKSVVTRAVFWRVPHRQSNAEDICLKIGRYTRIGFNDETLQATNPKSELTLDGEECHNLLQFISENYQPFRAQRLIPLSQVDQYLGLAGRIRNGAGFDFFGRS
jgi:hypothetical protein